MHDHPSANSYEQLHARLRQLILMRETGPKSAAWHAARVRMIWRLHDELRLAAELESKTTHRMPDQEQADPPPATSDADR